MLRVTSTQNNLVPVVCIATVPTAPHITMHEPLNVSLPSGQDFEGSLCQATEACRSTGTEICVYYLELPGPDSDK